ncbi:MAG: hypothetical protein KME32_30090 [Mojavia pulchra JT2-VF2]|jgi:hypothetical protein|uniref:Uncharacterized protein n=1 Tax=Mojavia pulchra JT2-VF2 TaxID=287848 RepID=A0A951UJ28_9NOST|nr:hypothetical protein [Mojavia pulchra JT2-VF2]
MQIADLSYIENVLQQELILGSDGVLVMSEASATGLETFTFAISYSITETLSGSNSTSEGTGFAVAVGGEPTATVTVAGDGDIVIQKIKSKLFQNVATASGFIKTISL